MELSRFTTARGEGIIRLAELADIPRLIVLNGRCFPSMVEENVVWHRSHLAHHQRLFPEGQLVAEVGGEVLGAVATLIVHLGRDPYRPHTYSGITDGGYFHCHDPEGDSLYGADIYVDPDAQGLGLGHHLYEARRQLCQRLNLRRIIAGGRIDGYAECAATMSASQYVHSVEKGERRDKALSFQLREGFVVRGILSNYITDPRSHNYATFIEWMNPTYRPLEDQDRKLRVACVQYQVRHVQSFEEYARQITYFVETAADYRADFVVFPEFVSMPLLSQPELAGMTAREGIAAVAELETPFIELLQGLARRFGLYIIGGSHPVRREGRLYNATPIISPDGRTVFQPKLHITPSEKKHWGIAGGDELRVVSTPKAKVGVLICYDAEFPEAARYLADQGAEIIFVPYCTDDRQAHLRVRYCAQARAIENQVFVVTAGIIGNLLNVPAMDIHYGQASVFTPSDFEFARDGIQAQADSNVEMLLVSDLDIGDLYRSRAAGSVTPRLDRRSDLFEFRPHLLNDVQLLNPDEGRPIDPPVEESWNKG